MAKDAKDTGDEPPKVFQVADNDVIEDAFSRYKSKAEDKSEIADGQKTILDELSSQYGVPAHVAKYIMKLEKMEDGPRGHSVRALLHLIRLRGLNDQQDLYDDEPNPSVSGESSANDDAEPWPDDKAVAAGE